VFGGFVGEGLAGLEAEEELNCSGPYAWIRAAFGAPTVELNR